jgi:hypothetical protein
LAGRRALESDKDNPDRVQTQMYVVLQIAAALSSLANLPPLQQKIIKNFKK